MNYEQALDYIHSIYKFGSKLGLDNINYLLQLMGNPQQGLKVIHVAGTNGKGSTCAYIRSVLAEQGFRVGLYTSPYLEEFTERIQINGVNIPKENLAEITTFVKEKVELMLSHGKNHPTEFEVVTAIGFEYFKRQKIDYLVLEVGLGGRGDSTNVIDAPLVSVITPIAYDHMDYLGDTLGKIAFEKAGIIKANCPVVTYLQKDEAMEVIEEVSRAVNAPLNIAPIKQIELVSYDDSGQCFHGFYGNEKIENLKISMLGEHQIENAAVALTALNILASVHQIPISKKALYDGFMNAKWPGRLEIITRNPTTIIDGAHNVHGMQALTKTIKKLYTEKSMTLVIGILGDKDVEGMLGEIVPLANRIILTKPNNPRAMALDKLAEMIGVYGKTAKKSISIFHAIQEALDCSTPDDLIVFCGSLYMIGDVRSILKEKK
ncbi:MAG: bifunctional folylpolyglutamate synthase/dihydrofolate synthase [Anaerosolibacter sp.]|jgi:dihydrofolate synthase/folylpolyglutamate synthase|uniref:bifunctional folylpolyglutamate synthase/dihydrofolate synthase n=1 Tax=Anaerosolibacter sp. TaxID=1872527 RepID=UPI00262C51C0|nr:folylpolyglutamate synthase/dihydrofolate synthase family protein [Anaerosolibacter sp.]MDF2547951.1 bifunctional folylpolyglutamate synthase/dihydrofolate synthase [Anaerosolibacter sp.]